jgi:hypothetical protein
MPAPTLASLRLAAREADVAYQRELIRVYGRDRANARRGVTPCWHADAALRKAGIVAERAKEAWHAEVARVRGAAA